MELDIEVIDLIHPMADAKKKPPPLPFKRISSLSCVIRLPLSNIHLLHENGTDDDNDNGVRWMIIGKLLHTHTIHWDT
jgi:hypothetical protein